MCLGVPGRLLEWIDRTEPFTTMIEFGGIRREVVMGRVADTEVGEYVIVHAGLAISLLSSEEAESWIADLANITERIADLEATS